jgi:hypothetical protein
MTIVCICSLKLQKLNYNTQTRKYLQTLLLFSQEPAALPYPVPLESSSHSPAFFNARFSSTSHIFSLIYNKIFSSYFTVNTLPIPVAERSEPSVCGRSLAGIVGSNFSGEWMSICCECCVLSGRVTCNGPILRPEESCRMCMCVCHWVLSGATINPLHLSWLVRERSD